jgi:hypothetical protein
MCSCPRCGRTHHEGYVLGLAPTTPPSAISCLPSSTAIFASAVILQRASDNHTASAAGSQTAGSLSIARDDKKGDPSARATAYARLAAAPRTPRHARIVGGERGPGWGQERQHDQLFGGWCSDRLPHPCHRESARHRVPLFPQCAVADLARPVEPVLLNLADPCPVLVEMTGVLPSHAHPQAHLRIMMR